MTRFRRLLPLIALSVLCAGCMTEAVNLTPVWAVIYGTVRSDIGSPVPGARIALRTQPEGVCPAIARTSVNVGTTEAFADSGGAYRAEVLYLAWPHEETRDFCVHLVATPPLAGGLQDTAFSVGPLRFSSIVSDSARADVMLSLP